MTKTTDEQHRPARPLPLGVELQQAAHYIRDLRRDTAELEATLQTMERRVVRMFNALTIPAADGSPLVAGSCDDIEGHLAALTPAQVWLLTDVAMAAEFGLVAAETPLRVPVRPTPLTPA